MNVTALSEIEQARFNMVEQQIRPWDVLDFRVLQALFEVQRERYVPAPMQGMAFSDVELPLIINAVDTRETMLTPKVEARLAQEQIGRAHVTTPVTNAHLVGRLLLEK